MPADAAWNPQLIREHDRRLAAAMLAYQRAFASERAMRGKFSEILKHSQVIAQVAHGQPARAAANESEQAMFGRFARAARRSVGRRAELNRSQLGQHHRHLRAMLPLFRAAAGQASALSKHLLEMEKNLRAITRMYR